MKTAVILPTGDEIRSGVVLERLFLLPEAQCGMMDAWRAARASPDTQMATRRLLSMEAQQKALTAAQAAAIAEDGAGDMRKTCSYLMGSSCVKNKLDKREPTVCF